MDKAKKAAIIRVFSENGFRVEYNDYFDEWKIRDIEQEEDIGRSLMVSIYFTKGSGFLTSTLSSRYDLQDLEKYCKYLNRAVRVLKEVKKIDPEIVV